MKKFRVSVSRLAVATRTITVEADSEVEATIKAVEQAPGEDFTGCTVDYEYKWQDVEPERVEVCPFCGLAMPDTIEQAIKDGWSPSFYDGDDDIATPVCGECTTKYLDTEHESGELVVKELKGEYVAELSTGEVRAPAVLNPFTRIIRLERRPDVHPDAVLYREYVMVGVATYQVASVEEKKDFSPEEQRTMFFWN